LIDDFEEFYDSGSFFDFFDVGEVVVRYFPKHKKEWNLINKFNISYM